MTRPRQLACFAALASLFALAAGGEAAAQTRCTNGRVATAQGYCCWPGQQWSVAQNHCSGPPSCPPGTEADGATCVASSAPAPAPVLVAPQPVAVRPAVYQSPVYQGAPQGYSATYVPPPAPQAPPGMTYDARGRMRPLRQRFVPDVTYYGDGVPDGAEIQERTGRPAATAGVVLTAFGYLFGVVGNAILNTSNRDARTDSSGYTHSAVSASGAFGLSLIPLVGSALAPLGCSPNAINTECGTYSLLVMLPISQIFQLVGAPMFFANFRRRWRVLHYSQPIMARAERPSRELQWAVLPSAPGATVGLSFVGTNF